MTSNLEDAVEHILDNTDTLREECPELLTQLRDAITAPPLPENREKLVEIANDLEEQFEPCDAEIERVNDSNWGLWVSISTGHDYEALTQTVESVGDYLSDQKFDVRALYDREGATEGSMIAHYQGHIFAAPVEYETPNYPADKASMRSYGDFESEVWRA